jgi:hypothetical protein
MSTAITCPARYQSVSCAVAEQERDEIAALIAKLEQQQREIDDLLKRARAAIAKRELPNKPDGRRPEQRRQERQKHKFSSS